jgi:hypothetical protein
LLTIGILEYRNNGIMVWGYWFIGKPFLTEELIKGNLFFISIFHYSIIPYSRQI